MVLNFPFNGFNRQPFVFVLHLPKFAIDRVHSTVFGPSRPASGPYRLGFRSAASTMACIFARLRPEIPAKAPILSRVRPSLGETFPECLRRPGAVLPCCRWRSFAAALS